MKKIILGLCVLVLVILSGCKATDNEDPIQYMPVFSGLEDLEITVNDEFDELEGVTASSNYDGDITTSITVSGTVDTRTPGIYELTYKIRDKYGYEVTVSRNVIVLDKEVEYPTGFYNYKFANSELRLNFLAAAEKYLLDGMIGGIPLYSNASYVMYHERVNLPVEYYIAVMGYGEKYGTMNHDDSTVLMVDGNYGNVGEYTYRTTISSNPFTYNQWLYDTSNDGKLMEMYYDSLYFFDFNDDMDGYSLEPSMASGMPIAVEPKVSETGKTISTKWNIPLRSDLEWFFHPDTDPDFIATNPDMLIDANDFVMTMKLALDKQWFRAVSGGGDFVSSAQGIVGVQDYLDGIGSWEDVGIKVIDDYTLQFEFVAEFNEFEMRYFISSFVQTPINLELYDYLETTKAENNGVNIYGTDIDLIGYHGGFYIDEIVEDEYLIMKTNPSFHDENRYFHDGYLYYIENNAQTIFDMFVDGLIEFTEVSKSNSTLYNDDLRIKTITGSTIYRLNINGLGTIENQLEAFPFSKWNPEPILANDDFRRALYLAIDRNELASSSTGYMPTNYYFNDMYLVDSELGIPYRSTEQGQHVGDDYFPDTLGYNYDEAKSLYLKAIEELIDSGIYQKGTQENPTVITLRLLNFDSNEKTRAISGFLEQAFEELFVDDVNFVRIEISPTYMDFPYIYYDNMMIGEFDLAIGGISGNLLCPSSFLDMFSSDNRSGFTMNFGIDTSVAEINVKYHDHLGVYYNEMWSYDAIASVLTGEVYIEEGEEADFPIASNIDVTPTTVSFDVENFDHIGYKNIFYTLQYYDFEFDVYYDVENYVHIPLTTKTIFIDGLTPFYYGDDEFGNIVYQGDYQILLEFDVVVGDRTEEEISPWFEMGELVEVVDSSVTTNGIEINLKVDSTDYERHIVLIDVYVDGIKNNDVIVDFSTLTAIMVSGLDTDSEYILKISFDDSLVTWLTYKDFD